MIINKTNISVGKYMFKKYYLLSLLSVSYLFSMEPALVSSVDFNKTYLGVLPQELLSQIVLYVSMLPQLKSCVIEPLDHQILVSRVTEEQLRAKAEETFSAFIKSVQTLGALLKMDKKHLESEGIHNTFLDVLSEHLQQYEIKLIAEFFRKTDAGSMLAPALISADKHKVLESVEQLNQALDNYLEKHSVLSTYLPREEILKIDAEDNTIKDLFLQFQTFLLDRADVGSHVSIMAMRSLLSNADLTMPLDSAGILSDFSDDDIIYPDKAALKAAPLYYAYATKSAANVFKNMCYSSIEDPLVELLYLTPLGSRFDKMFISALLATPQAFKWLRKYLASTPKAATDCLCLAAALDNKELALLALECGADSNGFQSVYCFKGTYLIALSKNKKLATYITRFTPLHIAAICGHKEIVEVLLQKGARLDVADSQGSTALTEAIMHRNKEMVKFLLEAGASPSFQTPGGLDPLEVAKQISNTNVREEIIALLKHYFAKEL